MADYIDILLKSFQSYKKNQTIEEIRKSLAQRLKNQFSIKYIPPTYVTQDVFWLDKHPFGGEMANWSRFPSPNDIEYEGFGNLIRNNLDFTPTVEVFQTHPDVPQMKMFLNVLDPESRPKAQVHEYKHMVTHKIPFDLIYLLAQKRYNQLVDDGYLTVDDDIIGNWLLKEYLETWMKGPVKQDPAFCLDESFVPEESRINRMKRWTDYLDKKLDENEQQDIIFFTSTPLEDDWMNFYECFLSDMDDLW